MPLSIAKMGLKSQIEAAYRKAMTEGDKERATPDSIIATLANDITNAIHTYTTQALVNINPGQMVNTAVVTAGTPAAQAGTGVGATTSTGTGTLS